MSIVLCDQLSVPALGGSANAGLGGASLQISPAEDGAPLRVKRFTYTIPASGAGSVAGDQIRIGDLNVEARIYEGKVFVPALGAGTTIAVGKIDPNNAANSDANHYAQPVSTVAAAMIPFDTNLTEQVGADPKGDQSTGNLTNPGSEGGGYGNAKVQVVLTIGGTPTAAVLIEGYFVYVLA